MKKLIQLLSLVIVCLAGCNREPMIQIDSSVQASLDAKNKPSSNTASVETPNMIATLVDMTTFVPLPEGSELSLYDYTPIYPNQLKIYSNGQQMYTMYMNFSNEDNSLSQVSERLGVHTVNTKLFSFENGALVQKMEQVGVAPMPNMLQSVIQTEPPQRILLQEPVRIGTLWDNGDTTQSVITALYEQGIINEVLYHNIVEVSTDFETYTLKEMYAAQEGLVLTWLVPKSEEVTEQQWQLVENYRDVKWSDDISLAVPNANEYPILLAEKGLLNVQTNETLAQAFTSLFREKGWLNEQVSIQQISVDDANMVSVDFTPGIVAAVNAHIGKEERLLPAIIQTIADYYQVQQVRLTVGGLILTPDRLLVPTDGIWQVEPQWLGQ